MQQRSKKKLWIWRTSDEVGHREIAWLNAGQLIYEPSIETGPRLNVRDFQDVCHKSVFLYVLTDSRWKPLAIALHNYIYRRWVRPYRSEVEYGQFICKFIALHRYRENLGVELNIESILSFNERLLEQVEACRPVYDAAEPNTQDPAGTGLFLPKDHQAYQTRPLSRALLMIIDSKDYSLEDSNTVGDIRVSLVRTGIEDGLSAPITFSTIQQQAGTDATDSPNTITTTLRAAIDFVIALEDRERAASAFITPGPSARYLWCWERDFGDQEPVRYPSSTFVSDENAAEWGWCGDSVDYDSRAMNGIERRIRRMFTDWEEASGQRKG